MIHLKREGPKPEFGPTLLTSTLFSTSRPKSRSKSKLCLRTFGPLILLHYTLPNVAVMIEGWNNHNKILTFATELKTKNSFN